jgi:hypothetical protein
LHPLLLAGFAGALRNPSQELTSLADYREPSQCQVSA